MAKTVLKAIETLRHKQNDLAHGMMKRPPTTLHEFYRACGEYTAFDRAIALLQETLTSDDEDGDQK